MKILITGSSGTVGRGIFEELIRRGHDVYGTDIAHQSNEIGFSLRTDIKKPRYAKCDVGEFRQIERVFEVMGPFDIVYHCAAEFGRWNGEDFFESLWRTNAVGTKNIIRLQERLKFKLIHFSSSEVYGDWEGVMEESVMDKHEIKQMNDYALSKWVNEAQIKNSRVQYNTQTVIVRLFNTYGPGEYYSPYRSVNCRFLYCALMHLPFVVFKGHHRTSTFLSDTVNTLATIVDNFKDGEVYNIGGDHYHSIEELAETILRVTGAPHDLVEYKNSEILTTKDKRVDVSKSIRDLGHKNTVSLEEGIRRTTEWMRKAYNLE